jgi:hypothetical protein
MGCAGLNFKNEGLKHLQSKTKIFHLSVRIAAVSV